MGPITDESLGRAIDGARSALGLSQREFSERMLARGVNWSPVTVSKVATGARSVKAVELPAVADALGVAVSDLLGEAADEITRLLTQAVIRRRMVGGVVSAVDQLLGATQIAIARVNAEQDRAHTPMEVARLMAALKDEPQRLEYVNWDADALLEVARDDLQASSTLLEWFKAALADEAVSPRIGRDPTARGLEVYPLDVGDRLLQMPEGLA